MLWVNYLVTDPWAYPMTFSFPCSERLPDAARLGELADGVHWGIVFLAVAGAVLAAVDHGLRWGYDLRVSGEAPRTALYAGIAPIATILTGLAAGSTLAGALKVSASTGRLQAGLSPGYGPWRFWWRGWPVAGRSRSPPSHCCAGPC